MPKKTYSEDLKLRVVNSVRGGRSIRATALEYSIPKSTVSDICRKYELTGEVCHKKGAGRPRKSTLADDRILTRIVRRDPRKTASHVTKYANENLRLNITARTARNILKYYIFNFILVCLLFRRANLHARRPTQKPLISKKNKILRLKFAKEHVNWSVGDWSRVLWSDESKFMLFNTDGIRYVRRPKNKKFDIKYTVPSLKHGGGSITVWGCFSRDIMGPLVKIDGMLTAVKYCEILDEKMLPHATDKLSPDWIYMQDNDPKHTARITKQWFKDNGVNVLSWPAQSPDLNPIENLWEYVDRKLREKNYSKTTELFKALNEEWTNIPLDYVIRLVDSMQSRCRAVIASRGNPTKY